MPSRSTHIPERISCFQVDLLRELTDPTVRAWLLAFHSYGVQLKNYLKFVEKKEEYIVARVHRVVRERLAVLESSAAGEETDDTARLWASLDEAVSEQAGFFGDVDILAIKKRIASIAGKYLKTRTAFLFDNPAILALGMLDTKGHAVRSATAFVGMKKQDNKIGLYQSLADHLHAEVDAQARLVISHSPAAQAHAPQTRLSSACSRCQLTVCARAPQMVMNALANPEYNGVLNVLDDDIFGLVEKFAVHGRTNPNATLSDEPEFAPLLAILKCSGKDLPISNMISEEAAKVVTKVLIPEMRRSSETAHRRGAAHLRKGLPPAEYLQANLLWARRRLRERPAKKEATSNAPPRSGIAALIRRVIGRDGGQQEQAAAAATVTELRAQQQEAKAYQSELLRVRVSASSVDSVPCMDLPSPAVSSSAETCWKAGLSQGEKKGMLVAGTIVAVSWGINPSGVLTFHLAAVQPHDSKTGPRSVRIMWLQEIVGENNTYEYSTLKPWHRPVSIAISRVLDVPRVARLAASRAGALRWRLLETGQTAEAAEQTATAAGAARAEEVARPQARAEAAANTAGAASAAAAAATSARARPHRRGQRRQRRQQGRRWQLRRRRRWIGHRLGQIRRCMARPATSAVSRAASRKTVWSG